jgi:RNA polymerase sigma-70 factor (ECF subfamily)
MRADAHANVASRGSQESDVSFSARLRSLREVLLRALRRWGVAAHEREDVAQQTLLELVRRRGQLEELPSDDLIRYARRATRGTASKAYRARDRRERLEQRWVREQAAHVPPIDDTLSHRQVVARRLEQLQLLPVELSSLIIACEFDGLTLSEAARQQGLPLGTVKSRVRRAHAKCAPPRDDVPVPLEKAQGARRRSAGGGSR